MWFAKATKTAEDTEFGGGEVCGIVWLWGLESGMTSAVNGTSSGVR